VATARKDARAIQRGCNIVNDTQGQLAKDGARERWNAEPVSSRSTHSSCDHLPTRAWGDKQDAAVTGRSGRNGLARLVGNWRTCYDRFTGLCCAALRAAPDAVLHQFSKTASKPNADDDLIRDVTAYSRFPRVGRVILKDRQSLLGKQRALMKIPALCDAQGVGDDYVRGASCVPPEDAASVQGPRDWHGSAGAGTPTRPWPGPEGPSPPTRA